MTKRKTIFSVATLFIVIGIIIGLSISSNLHVKLKGVSLDTATVSAESTDILSQVNDAMTQVVEKTVPSVVNISSKKTVTMQGFGRGLFDDPFFRRFFGNQFPQEKDRNFQQSGLGSGVIVDKDGLILTNNHVIDDADEITVRLSDKREFKGKVIGSDPKTDLAVVKIDAHDLPAIKFGDSDKLRVGEMVIAIGIPYGLNQTVTSGIVSAVGRANVGIADYEDFIQTDAPINPGNSGGALVNIHGELVGINTAIFSTSGGYQGIGFAVPTNMAKVVMDSLIKTGKVTRGWLGVSIQEVTPELAKHFNLESGKGVLVGDVVPDSPAEKAGLKRGDVIVQYDGKDVEGPTQLRNMVAQTVPGSGAAVSVIRDGKTKTLTVKIAELPAEAKKVSGTFNNDLKGVSVSNLTPAIKEQLDIPDRVSGVVVTAVEPDSPAQGALAEGDVIMEVNRRSVKNTDDYGTAVSKVKSGEGVLLLVYRKGSTIYLTINGG